jgi:hypothetical protein
LQTLQGAECKGCIIGHVRGRVSNSLTTFQQPNLRSPRPFYCRGPPAPLSFSLSSPHSRVSTTMSTHSRAGLRVRLHNLLSSHRILTTLISSLMHVRFLRHVTAIHLVGSLLLTVTPRQSAYRFISLSSLKQEIIRQTFANSETVDLDIIDVQTKKSM